MTAVNRGILENLLESIHEFNSSRIGFEDLQAQLLTCHNLLEGRPVDLMNAIRGAEADLESIRFTSLVDEQLPKAVFILDPLRQEIRRAIADMDSEQRT